MQQNSDNNNPHKTRMFMKMFPNDIEVNKPLVLIADDNVVTVQLLGTFLEKAEIDYISCNNGIAALDLAKSHKPDLILMDVMMPVLDGFEACKKLKQDDTLKAIPVIFLSSKAESYDKVKGFKCGAVDYITKPFERTEVIMRIETQINLKRAYEQLERYNQMLEELLEEKQGASLIA